MFRRWSTILGPEDLDTEEPMKVAALDSDVIMTAAMLGFSAGRLAVGHPVEFAIDYADKDSNKLPQLRATVAKINRALGDYKFKGTVEATITPPWEKGAVITGAAGASRTPFNQRRVTDLDPVAKELKELASQIGDESIGYQGFGAYTGFIADPIHHKPGIQSTVRYNVPVEGYGSRWVPPRYQYKERDTQKVVHNEKDSPWGVIMGASDLPKDMVRQDAKLDKRGNVVGYTHGMIQAVYLATQRGPWCTPFEIAAGQVTTKLASCFTCSLFMYAAGFPPSAIHIGQGNSWVPLYEQWPGFDDEHHSRPMIDPAPEVERTPDKGKEQGKEKAKKKTKEELEDDDHSDEVLPLLSKREHVDTVKQQRILLLKNLAGQEEEAAPEIIKGFVTHKHDPEYNQMFHATVAALNNRWRVECRQHLLLGVEIMQQNGMAAVSESHRPRLARLATVLNVIASNGDVFGAANLILDAVTIHDHESARVDRTLI